ncbi:MAG TPA: NAD-dependent epimerase/dehydratase family protein [Candidatus Saccharimonadales bacterium]|nr:NAD-dependent epimerase/dehydratase family protein [Candidatus Saccharimonadales bacterium]
MAGHPLSADLDHILLHTEPLWEEARGRRLFVTGGTGFFGCWLLESFAWANERLALGAEMFVLTRQPEAFARKAPHLAGRADLQFLTGNVRDFKFPPGEFSHIIHAATEASAKLNEENPALMFDTIIGGAQHVLDFASQCGAKKFLLTSSGAVYGVQPPTLSHLAEEYPGAPDVSNPLSAYGEGKRASEVLCAMASRGGALETKIARCFAFVGPYLPLDSHFAAGNFIRDAMAGRTIQIKGDGTPFRSYLYAADLAIWLWTILFRGASNRPYNVGSSHAITIAETAAIVARVAGQNATVAIAQKPSGAGAARYVPATTRAESELGLRERVGLEDAIRRTAEWHRRH